MVGIVKWLGLAFAFFRRDVNLTSFNSVLQDGHDEGPSGGTAFSPADEARNEGRTRFGDIAKGGNLAE